MNKRMARSISNGNTLEGRRYWNEKSEKFYKQPGAEERATIMLMKQECKELRKD